MIAATDFPMPLTIKWLFLIVFMMLTACSQTQTYAPVKTVNQTVVPRNKDASNISTTKPPVGKNTQQPTGQTIRKAQSNNLVRQQAFSPAKPKPDADQNIALKNNNPKGLASAPSTKITKNKINASLEKKKEKPTITPDKIDVNRKNQAKTGLEENNSNPKRQKPAGSTEPAADQNKIKSALSKPSTNATKNNTVKPTQLATNRYQDSQKNIMEKSTISNDNKKMLKLNFDWPIRGKISKNFAQTDHKGIDIIGKMDQSVIAAESGKAVYCGHGLKGFGNLAIIKHNETYLSAYANNSKLFIKEGQQVSKGQTIGQVGIVGLKKASLHFEIRKNGKPINPLSLLPKH